MGVALSCAHRLVVGDPACIIMPEFNAAQRPASVGTAVLALSPNLSRRRRHVRISSARSRAGFVVSQNRMASETGARVLKAGGYAVDAAVATAFALGVIERWMSGIGGVGSMLVHQAASGETVSFDFGPRSPIGLDASDFPLSQEPDEGNLFGWPKVVGKANTMGAKAVAAPTEPAGLAAAHKRFGRIAWRHPGARTSFLPNGYPPVPPRAINSNPLERLSMADLARTLRAIAEDGADVLCREPVERSIAEDIRAMGAHLGVEDLAAVRAREVKPLTIAYGKRSIQVLRELNGGPTLRVGFDDFKKRRTPPKAKPDAETFATYVRAVRVGWQDRFKHLGDEQAFHQPRIDVSGLGAVVLDRRMPQEMIETLAAEFATVIAEPVAYPFPYTIASAARRVGARTRVRPRHSIPGRKPWARRMCSSSRARPFPGRATHWETQQCKS